jgi:hypothetical protein
MSRTTQIFKDTTILGVTEKNAKRITFDDEGVGRDEETQIFSHT